MERRGQRGEVARANKRATSRQPFVFSLERLLRRRAAGETLTEIARSFNVSRMTIARLGSE